MLFVAAAIGGGLIADMTSSPPQCGRPCVGPRRHRVLLNVYALRMAAVFTLPAVDHRAPNRDHLEMAHRRRARERAGAPSGRWYLTLGEAVVPGLDPGAEH